MKGERVEVLLGKTLTELQEVALSVGLQKFAGKQLAQWLYVQRVRSMDEMTNISLKGREALKRAFIFLKKTELRFASLRKRAVRWVVASV